VYSTDDADMTRIVKIREPVESRVRSQVRTKLTYMPFFVRPAWERAASFFPTVNASASAD